MSKKVVSLKAVTPLTVEPNPEVVDKMKELLGYAESGKLQTMLFIGAFSTGEAVTAFSLGSVGEVVTMIGEAAIMSAELQRIVLQTRYEVGEYD